MRAALRDRLIAFNPCDGVRLPPIRRKDTDDQTIEPVELIGRLLPAVPERYRALVALAGGTGLRWGECVGLRWDAVDLAPGSSGGPGGGGGVRARAAKPYPKSKAGRRTVPLPPFVVELLRVHQRDFETGVRGSGVRGEDGRAVEAGHVPARVWKPSLVRARLPVSLRFHDLRHSYATWLVSDGVPINDVAKVMGHEQTSTTLDRYTHSTRDRDRRVLASFAAFSLPPGPVAGVGNEAGPLRGRVLTCTYGAALFDLPPQLGHEVGAGLGFRTGEAIGDEESSNSCSIRFLCFLRVLSSIMVSTLDCLLPGRFRAGRRAPSYSLPRPEEPDLQSILVDMIHLLELLQRHSFNLFEDEQGAIRFGNRGQQALNKLPSARLLRFVLLLPGAGSRIGQLHDQLREVRHPRLAAPALFPQIIIRCIDRQSVKPRFKDIRCAELIQGEIQTEGHLPHVLHVIPAPDEPVDCTQNPPAISQDDFIERSFISTPRAFYQCRVNQHAMPVRPAPGRPISRCPTRGINSTAAVRWSTFPRATSAPRQRPQSTRRGSTLIGYKVFKQKAKRRTEAPHAAVLTFPAGRQEPRSRHESLE